MPRVAYTNHDVNLIARMMRAEAVGEGRLGMLMVGNVIVNRARADCLDFQDLRSIREVVFQVQGGNYSFEAVQKGSLFYSPARGVEKKLAREVLKYWRKHPAKYALWYFNPSGECPPTWYGQPLTGQYKQHCYYEPIANTCASAYRY
ncbi:N-acetylmuramoyl-L-alanine amidase [Virgibacillus subterraneus]|uniref:N-acetylmuramoyl-L-alanine amidase n=2 Tax=Virgibacillus TaxID=84406 RepID=A0A1H1DXC8_9BACI|nr:MULTISPECIES: cell wall hydrolase [Virgibacillus]SDQ81202.1 N-acetylmuramoyl-L-alanine amidase [Virgibacillus salinus]SER06987.1 N-acetylmuramoyl-L-alanine amidase [Virgibacillus subterraneus]